MSNTFQKFQSNETAQIQIPRVIWAGSEELQKETVATVSTAVQLLRDQKRGPDNTILLDRYVLVSRAALACALDDAVQKQFNRSTDERLATFIKRYGNFLAMAMTIGGVRCCGSNRETDRLFLYVFMVRGELDWDCAGDPMKFPYTSINLRVGVILRSGSKTKTSYEKTFGAPLELLMGFPAVIIDLNAELLLDGAVFADVAA